MTDTQALSLIQRLLLEPVDGGVTWASGLWTRVQVLALLHDTQMTFVRRTRLLRGWAEVPYAAHGEVVPLPEGILQVIAADTVQDGVWRPCPTASRAELDQLLAASGAVTPGIPRVCLLEQPGTRRLTLAPIPSASGVLHLQVVPVPDVPTGLGDPLSVGAVWAPFIVAGTLARMLSVPGVVYQPTRAARFAGFFDLGVQFALRRLQPPA